MEHEAWPTPQTPAREPLPRVDDLPVAEQGYEQESVRAAFDSFYRHAAQLDAALRTLEAVDSFHRSAASLRADLRSLRAAGWTQQSWTQPPSYGYGMRAPREGVPPAVWRIGGEVAFLVVVAVALGVAQLSWWAIVVAMAGAFAIVCLIEWLAGREQMSFVRPAAASSPRRPSRGGGAARRGHRRARLARLDGVRRGAGTVGRDDDHRRAVTRRRPRRRVV